MKHLSLRLFAWTGALAVWLLTVASQAAEPRLIHVTLYNDGGAFGQGVPRITEQLGKVKDIDLKVVSGKDILSGALAHADVVIFSGGSGSKQAAAIGDSGRETVRKFVSDGGGYVGICGGAFLACSGFNWGLGIVNAKTVSSKWQRGKGEVRIEITPAGAQVTGFGAGEKMSSITTGPSFAPRGEPICRNTKRWPCFAPSWRSMTRPRERW